MDEEQAIERLKMWASDYGIQLSSDQAEKMIDHLQLLLEANTKLNLTRITDFNTGLVLHILDSLLLTTGVKALDQKHNERCMFLDIGTGGGFPGIPFAIATSMNGTVIDSVAKKIVAVNQMVGQLGLTDRIQALSIRAETLALDSAGVYSLVVARAVAAMPVLLEYATPLLTEHGLAIFTKGAVSYDELNDSQRVAELCGLELVSRETFELPMKQGSREIYTFQKVSPAQVKLPRRVGVASHRPL